MTVKELIQFLLRQPQDATIWVNDTEGEYREIKNINVEFDLVTTITDLVFDL
jgi:hypothetical protein